MKKLKQLETIPTGLQHFLKEYPPEKRDKRGGIGMLLRMKNMKSTANLPKP